jgi:hypothetical protein
MPPEALRTPPEDLRGELFSLMDLDPGEETPPRFLLLPDDGIA